ncbi:uncharacterized protein [Spinacia oleracea]|uniref:Uncharacterized protein isoform X3 n=1 Tax=Spinacia oleracea TaxID=3562 RepID=A0ABM3R3Z5_SPIOL|nr:uncharacterized protein LOC110793503 isoform X3 [Spinacia oleracea]
MEIMSKNRKTIEELQQLYLEQEDNQDIPMTYTCKAQIEMLDVRDFGWKYESCRVCKTKLDEDHMCKKCGVIDEFPTQRYRIVITVKEGDAYMRIGMFDKTVEKIVQMPISAMIKISTQQYGDEKVHERFENCIGNSFVFKVQVNKRGFTQELTAIKVFTLDEEKEDNQTQSTDLTQTLVQMATNKRSATEIEASTSISTHQGLKKIKQEKLKGKE